MLTQDRLKELFYYDQLTGNFIRKVATGSKVKVGDIAGSRNTIGYIQICIDYKVYLAHRLAVLYMEGYWPNEVDHRDTVRDNNKWANLREATSSQNSYNMATPKTNTSGVKGVSYSKRDKCYSAEIKVETKRVRRRFYPSHYVTTVDCLEAARLWIEETRNTLHGDFARI